MRGKLYGGLVGGVKRRTVVEGFQCQCRCEESCMRGKLYETVLIS